MSSYDFGDEIIVSLLELPLSLLVTYYCSYSPVTSLPSATV